jgi:hypothetical protein
MVKHHVLIGLGLKRQNFRNRALKYMVDRNIIGSSLNTMRPAVEPPMRLAVMPPSYSRPTVGRGPLPAHRAPLKFNY